ncbi:MAG: hypothetical protein NUV80_02685 [Candidatus Berkelbacteria bacterium]|nr:hypothetical protein [Candidatus Berkelbacteria bacterium]
MEPYEHLNLVMRQIDVLRQIEDVMFKEPNPTYDRESEQHQEAVDLAEQIIRDGDFDMSEIIESLNNLPSMERLQLYGALQDHDLLRVGTLVYGALLKHFIEQEHE